LRLWRLEIRAPSDGVPRLGHLQKIILIPAEFGPDDIVSDVACLVRLL
jgi:hypothetical protein